MITLTKTPDNMFRITYINEAGIELGYASAEFTAKEVKTLIKLNELYFDEVYLESGQLDTLSLGIATKAILQRGVVFAGNEQFENSDLDTQRKDAASAIYAYLTTKQCEQFKDKLREHGYEVE